ncbi:MAG: amidinotransferase [Myxococcales bacterium]|nr:amidinotransferase [Myxococcales bacterium]
MGEGWRPRGLSHAQEMGTVWGDYGLSSEVARLTAVLLTGPGDELAYAESPAAQLMYSRPDLGKMRDEAAGVADAYASRGVAVHWLLPRLGTRPDGQAGAPPNLVFARDLAFMTPQGAVLARMASGQRAGEERCAAAVLAGLGIPILATPTGTATFEGPDALWVRPDLVLVGVGRRTNEAGYRLVRRVLADQGVRCAALPMSPGVQHLLGMVNFIDTDLAALRHPTPRLRRCLDGLGVKLLDLSADPMLVSELAAGRSHNFVTMAPRVVLMPAGNPRTRGVLEAEGVEVIERAVSQYLCAAGGIGCLTGVLGRSA